MKKRVNRKRMQGRTVCIQSALLLLLLFMLAGCGGGQQRDAAGTDAVAERVSDEPAAGGSMVQSGAHTAVLEAGEKGQEGGLAMEFIDVGQGDSTLILCEGEAMLIDAGDESSGTNVQNELEKLGVDELKYFVCTHPDADHIGGADVIAYKFPVETLLMPELERDTKAYEQLAASISERDIPVAHPSAGESYDLGGGSFTVVGPVEQYSEDETNNWSVCLRFTYGEMRFLFCGDAEKEAEKDMLAAGVELGADVYHVSHHGSSGSTSPAFLQAVEPSYAVVSCGRDNDYGHPHEETREVLAARQVRLYRTDELGNIFCYSDGKTLNWESEYGSVGENGAAGERTAPEDAAGEAASGADGAADRKSDVPEGNALSESARQDYVLNVNSKKIHLPGCESVARMKAKNRREVHAALEELLDEGYSPCENCMG